MIKFLRKSRSSAPQEIKGSCNHSMMAIVGISLQNVRLPVCGAGNRSEIGNSLSTRESLHVGSCYKPIKARIPEIGVL